MDIIFEIMKILIPGTLVVIAVQIVMNNYHTQQKMRDLAILKKKTRKKLFRYGCRPMNVSSSS